MNLRSSVSLSIVALAAAAAHGQIIASDNFESRTLGAALNTQSGWDATGSAGVNISNVQAIGTKSARADFSTAGWASGSRWNWQNFSYDSTTTNKKVLRTSVSIFMGDGHTAGSLLGLDAYNASGRVAMTRINAQTGAITLTNFGGTSTTTSLVAAKNRWNELSLVLDFTAKTARTLLNGVDTGTSVALFSTDVDVSDVDLIAFKATGDTGNSVYFDNYKAEAVPEPATLVVLGLGALGVARRRRKA